MRPPEGNAGDPERRRPREVLEERLLREAGHDARDERQEPRRHPDPERPRASLGFQTVPSVRERDARSDGEDQKREAAHEEDVQEIDAVSRDDCRQP